MMVSLLWNELSHCYREMTDHTLQMIALQMIAHSPQQIRNLQQQVLLEH